MPLVYLGNCAIQRPLDDRTAFRVRIEAEAMDLLLREIQSGRLDVLGSDVLPAEVQAAPDVSRRDFATGILGFAQRTVALEPRLRANAEPLRDAGVKALDALHVASAIAGRADYFCTTDDSLLRKLRAANLAPLRVVTPTELALALNL